jgi:hypothetical protein
MSTELQLFGFEFHDKLNENRFLGILLGHSKRPTLLHFGYKKGIYSIFIYISFIKYEVLLIYIILFTLCIKTTHAYLYICTLSN